MTALLPYFIGFAAVICYAALGPLAKKALPDIPPFAFMAITTMLLGFCSILGSAFLEKDFSFASLKPSVWGGLLLFALINLFAFWFELLAIKRIAITEYQMIYILSPIFAAVFAYFLLSEPFKLRYLIGLVVMGAGLFIALYSPAKS